MTAHRAVFVAGPVQGKTLLVTGGAGAVGHYAVQLATWAGARVIATVSSAEKAERARAGGAAHVINYRQEDVAACVLDITGGIGVDHIAEVDFGGNLAAALQCLRVNGSMMIYATNGDREPKVPVMLAAINAGSGRNSATESKFPTAVLTRSFDYGAEMHILMKDIDLAVAQGEEIGVPMWVCEVARLVFKHAMHKGAAKEDLTAIVKYIERDAGFEMPKTR